MNASAHDIKQLAQDLGFDACGLAPAKSMSDEMEQYKAWLAKGYHAGMTYLENYQDIRQDPVQLLDGVKTVLVTLSNYYPNEQQNQDTLPISKYAFGKDYHKILLKRHKNLLAKIQEIVPCQGRIFVDTAPVLERAWAVEAGLGWIGKSNLLISPTLGNHTFISGIMLDIEIEVYDKAMTSQCGECRKCLDACPTGALCAPYQLDARKCLSYLSIEHRGPFKGNPNLHGRFYGCDTCMDICPYNKRIPHQNDSFKAIPKIMNLPKAKWETINERDYKELIKGSAIKRLRYKDMQRNLASL